MAIVAQLVRASACGAEGRRFESGLSPHFIPLYDFEYERIIQNFPNSFIPSSVLSNNRLCIDFINKISQVLSYVEYSSSEVLKIFSEKTNRFCRKNLISNNEKNQLLKNFKASIDGYTYFEN